MSIYALFSIIYSALAVPIERKVCLTVKNRSFISLKGSRTFIRGIEVFFEVGVLTVLYYFVWRFGYEAENFPQYLGFGKYVLMGVYGILAAITFKCFDSFQFGHLRLTDIVVSQVIALVIVNFIAYFQLSLIANKLICVIPMLILMLLQTVVIVVLPYIYSAIFHRIYRAHKMIMVCGRDCNASLKIKMESRPDKYRIHKIITLDEGLDAIFAAVSEYDSVILNDISAKVRNDILKFCYDRKIRTYVTPKLSDIMIRGSIEICLFDTPLLLVRGSGLTFTQSCLKRTMDIVLCLVAMVVALPVMLVTAVAIKLDDGGPVFYKQKRVTLDGKIFEILKFRSMIVNAEAAGKSIPATDNDLRITKVGKIIRATRIDELPQIINILKGDMSIVGPRPERVEHVEKYTSEIPEFCYRTKVKGGLTGYAQIYGKYNTTAYDKLRLDLMYIENYSIMLDIKLILLTLRVIFKKESTEGFDKVVSTQKIDEVTESSASAEVE